MSAQTAVLYVQGRDDATRRALDAQDDLVVYSAATQGEASDVLGSARVDCIVCPHDRDDGPSGRRLLERLTTSHPGVPAILTSDQPDDDLAAAVAAGAATEYLPLGIWDDPTARLRERVAHHADVRVTAPNDQTLGGLLATARELMTTRKPGAIASVVTDAAVDILSFERAAVWLLDDVTSLAAVASPDHDHDTVGRRPHDDQLSLADARPTDFDWQETYAPGDEPVGRVFESGEPTVIEHDDGALMFFPLGDHGVLAVGADGVDAIDDADVQLAEILTANAAAGVDRARREQTLSLYQTVVDNVSEMMYVLDDTGNVVLASDEVVAASGYDREDILGAHVSQFIGDDGLERGTELIAELVAGGNADATRTYRTTALTADGDAIPAEIEMSLLTDDDGNYQGTIGAIRDISDLLAAEAERDRERDRFRSLFEHLPDPVIDTRFEDGEPIIDSVNPAFERVFGHEEADIVGGSVNDVLVPHDDDEIADDLDARALADETVSAELTRTTAEGDRHFLFRGIPYHVEGEVVHAFGIYTDITDQYDRERHLQVLHRVLRHNLRTDMGIVTGHLSQLTEDLDDPDAVGILDHVIGRAEDAAALADKVHQLEQVIRKDSAFTTEPTNVAERVRALAERLGDTYPEATITTRAPETTIANADERLDLAVENLVENAVEHAQRPDPVVEITVTEREDTVAIAVADNGPGIPDHERDLLTGDRTVSRVEHGEGLGLWVVSWVARSLGGTVSFGDPDQGSEVVLELRTP